MAPGPGSPLIFGMQERVRRGLVRGNMYVVFFKGVKLIGEYKGAFDADHVIIHSRVNVYGIMTNMNFVFARRWVFELNEATALLN